MSRRRGASRVQLQAVHLLGGAGEGIHSDHDSPRRTDRLPGFGHRFAGLGTEELRRQIRGTDALAHGAGQVEEHGSIRVLQSIGTHYAQDYATRFGFEAEKHPPT